MKIAVLTNLSTLHPGYSLVHVIGDQLQMLVRHGHEPTVLTPDDFPVPYPRGEWHGCPVKRVFPSLVGRSWTSTDQLTTDDCETVNRLTREIADAVQNFDVVFTHDLIWHDRSLPFAEAINYAAPLTSKVPFLHWVHSVPTRRRDWWNLKRYGRNHKIVYPTKSDKLGIASQFRCSASDIRVIPHIVDMRLIRPLLDETTRIIDAMLGLLSAEFVKVYPAAADRLKDKGLRNLIMVFKELKRRQKTVCLLVVDSWPGHREREDLTEYRRLATRNGLTFGEFRFTTEIDSTFSDGLPREAVSDLMQLSSVFAYPTRGESFGLILPEACLSGGVLPVPNGSLSMAGETIGRAGLYPEFGSAEKASKHTSEREFYDWVARLIVARSREDDSIVARNHVRRKLNMDAVYRTHYEPVLTEAPLWI